MNGVTRRRSPFAATCVAGDTLLRHYKKHNDEVTQAAHTREAMPAYETTSNAEVSQHSIDNGAVPQLQGNVNHDLNMLENWQPDSAHSIVGSVAPESFELDESSSTNCYPQVHLDQNLPTPDSQTMGGSLDVLQDPVYDIGNALRTPLDLSWLNGYDFDLQALNTSVATAIEVNEPLFQPQPDPTAISQELHLGMMAVNGSRRKVANDEVRRKWFCHLETQDGEIDSGLITGQSTPVNAGVRYDIGDKFRFSIAQRLRAHVNDEPLPSTNFLNLSARMYFTKFSPIFPVIHSQKFRPSPKNSLLLLSITSIGSLLLGSKGAAGQGTRIFERLNKAILASWEKILVSDSTEALSMIQAALIGQTFGLLSGIPKHLAIVESFHGTIIAWARRCGMFSCQEDRPQLEHLSGPELEDAWKTWARTVIGLYIHDAKISSMFHHEPFLRHDVVRIPIAAEDDLFNAPTAAVWREQMLSRSSPRLTLEDFWCFNSSHNNMMPKQIRFRRNHFSAYFALYTISATIGERQQTHRLNPGCVEFSKSMDMLTNWYNIFQNEVCQSESNPDIRPDLLYLMGLWHTTFMNLLVNFDLLERAIGRDSGADDSLNAAHSYAVKWANSTESVRCILHAQALLNSIGAMRLDAEPAIHIPHCLFLAGIAGYCFTRFRQPSGLGHAQSGSQSDPGSSSSAQPDPATKYHEFKLRGPSTFQHLFGVLPSVSSGRSTPLQPGYINGPEPVYRPKVTIELMPDMISGMMRTVIDTLQRMGHWKIAQQYAMTLSTLVFADEVEDTFMSQAVPEVRLFNES
ncbi:hypothetical protein G7Y89_g5752 [Cudoniella acicularis]|uniref:Xylanolytic transcriptional activator regulatory domain-containing protein n=1 Tax=Cudoniella acicularis TaxID=354080 RepID=A0A8H4W342_9HELO|nr:hypothetical protein G7Y89_g5752 [Cudoniella acicularis]